MTTDHDNLTPGERALAGAIDRDAAALSAEPDAGFESRVLAAAMHAEPAAPVIATIGPRLRPALGVAAAIVVLLTLGVVASVVVRPAPNDPLVIAGAGSGDAGDVLADIDAWLALDDGVFARTNLAAFREELDSADAPVSFDDLGQTDLDFEEWM